MNTNPEWKLSPATATPEMVKAGLMWLVHFQHMRIADKRAALASAFEAMLAAAPEAPPLTVTVDPDARGVSVGVYQGSSCLYSGAHPIPASTVATEGEQLATFEANFPNAPLSASKFHELWSLASAGCSPRHALLDNLRWQVGVFAGLVAREAIASAPAAGDAPAWHGLTDAERDGFVGEIADYGTDFVSPLYAVVESIERRLRDKNAAIAQQSQRKEA